MSHENVEIVHRVYRLVSFPTAPRPSKLPGCGSRRRDFLGAVPGSLRH
jgi:hypothetical protein